MLDRPLFTSGEMSMTEIMNAKTLVTSYREAANFLYRAASELEQLLPTDHRVFWSVLETIDRTGLIDRSFWRFIEAERARIWECYRKKTLFET